MGLLGAGVEFSQNTGSKSYSQERNGFLEIIEATKDPGTEPTGESRS